MFEKCRRIRSARKHKAVSKPPAGKKKEGATIKTMFWIVHVYWYKQWTEEAMLGPLKTVSEGLGQKKEFSCAGQCNWFMERWSQLSLHKPDSLGIRTDMELFGY